MDGNLHTDAEPQVVSFFFFFLMTNNKLYNLELTETFSKYSIFFKKNLAVMDSIPQKRFTHQSNFQVPHRKQEKNKPFLNSSCISWDSWNASKGFKKTRKATTLKKLFRNKFIFWFVKTSHKRSNILRGFFFLSLNILSSI